MDASARLAITKPRSRQPSAAVSHPRVNLGNAGALIAIIESSMSDGICLWGLSECS